MFKNVNDPEHNTMRIVQCIYSGQCTKIYHVCIDYSYPTPQPFIELFDHYSTGNNNCLDHWPGTPIIFPPPPGGIWTVPWESECFVPCM